MPPDRPTDATGRAGADWPGGVGGADHAGDPGTAGAGGEPRGDRSGTGQGRGPGGPGSTGWPRARRIARTAAPGPLPATVRPLGTALGHSLARSLPALTDLPAFDTSAMDGWAVSGPGPWRLSGQVLAGETAPEPLEDGTAIRIATGAQLPHGATAVLRRESGGIRRGTLHADRAPEPGQDVRPRGQECRSGDTLLPAGAPVTPVVLGLAAAAGYDELAVVTRPTAEVLVLGDELLHSGLPRGGRVRDALGPLLGPWLDALGADVLGTRRLGDDADALREAVESSTADVVVTTGGTAAGPVDFVHPVLAATGARLLVDGVAVRPGHPMLLAALADGRHLIGLPGNPLAAVSGVVTLAAPLLATLAGRPAPEPFTAPLAAAVPGHPTDTRLVPVAVSASVSVSASGSDQGPEAVPLHFNGPAMLRGLASADGLAVIPPGGAAAGTEADILEIAW